MKSGSTIEKILNELGWFFVKVIGYTILVCIFLFGRKTEEPEEEISSPS